MTSMQSKLNKYIDRSSNYTRSCGVGYTYPKELSPHMNYVIVGNHCQVVLLAVEFKKDQISRALKKETSLSSFGPWHLTQA